MNLREFLLQPQVCLPIIRETADFASFVATMFSSYLNLIDQLETPVSIAEKAKAEKHRLEKFCILAQESINASLKGLPFDAYEKLKDALTHIIPFLEKPLLAELDDRIGNLYRVRLQVSPPFTREQLFHIPFELRHKVATQRYSVPGLPCLYLSGSLLTCWAEMGRPAFHKIQASAFWLSPNAKVKVINFTNRPARLARYIVNDDGTYLYENEERLLSHIVLWPLLALCSIKVLYKIGRAHV